MTHPIADPDLYRPCTGIVIFNSLGQVWLGKRAGHTGQYIWQFPQGGTDPGETPEYAAIREMEEETGISVQKVSPLGQIKEQLFYDYPEDVRTTPRTKRWRGQRQYWYAYRFHGGPKDINLEAHTPPEFSQWRWGNLSETPDLIVPFKRKVYEQLVVEFGRYAKPAR